MVQYIPTPWRDHRELVLVRDQFYGNVAVTSRSPGRHHDTNQDDETDTRLRRQPDDQQRAVERVSMWMRRGNCPHMVESTALLVAAILSDAGEIGARYAVRAAYSAAFSRFVTGLADGHQEKQRKQSMYAVAKTIGLPATFVELRHQATHEQLPSLARLRPAAQKALDWIWHYYWKHLDAAEPGAVAKLSDPCREIVLGHLRGGAYDDAQMAQTLSKLEAWDVDLVLTVIDQVQESLPGNQVYLRCLKLSQEVVKNRRSRPEQPQREAKLAEVSHRDHTPEVDAASYSGWSLYQGPWEPKPIGMV